MSEIQLCCIAYATINKLMTYIESKQTSHHSTWLHIFAEQQQTKKFCRQQNQ